MSNTDASAFCLELTEKERNLLCGISLHLSLKCNQIRQAIHLKESPQMHLLGLDPERISYSTNQGQSLPARDPNGTNDELQRTLNR